MNRIYVCMEHPFAILETHLVAWHIVSYSVLFHKPDLCRLHFVYLKTKDHVTYRIDKCQLYILFINMVNMWVAFLELALVVISDVICLQ